jgi:hypothetical protein
LRAILQWVSKLSFKKKKEQKDFAVAVVVAAAVVVVVHDAIVYVASLSIAQ